MGMGGVGGIAAFFAGFGLCLAFAIATVFEAYEAYSGRVSSNDRPKSYGVALLLFLTALILAAVPCAAAAIAERSTGWVDADGNGALDPMSNGNYDYFDIVGDTLFIWWVVLTTSVLFVLWLLVRLSNPNKRVPVEDRDSDAESSASG